MNTVKVRIVRNPIEAFAEHLVEQFQMSAEQALERVNRELAANPLTNDIQLELPTSDSPASQR